MCLGLQLGVIKVEKGSMVNLVSWTAMCLITAGLYMYMVADIDTLTYDMLCKKKNKPKLHFA